MTILNGELRSADLGEARPQRGPITRFVIANRRALSSLLVFLVLLAAFILASPQVFLNPGMYVAIFRTLPVSIILATSLVFVIASGEIDLSFGSVVGITAWAFSVVLGWGINPFIAVLAAVLMGAFVGFINGIIVTRLGLSSLVSTLGMSFLLRGFINVATQGEGFPLTYLRDTPFYNAFIGQIGGIPAHALWALGFIVVGILLFNYHRFGTHICCVGDNLESAREMGINSAKIKTMAFIYVGIASAISAILFSLTNQIVYPTTGDGLLLPTLAAVFVGGTPGWGGVGSIAGAAIGACTVGIIESGIVATGFSHLFKEFFYGLILILALTAHKVSDPRRQG